METIVVKIDKGEDEADILKTAADILRQGGLVAIPTETVYGLGANALDLEASRKIYEAKGRPSDNPLIVHISSYEMLETVARNIPENGWVLAKKFWPGPLTLVLEKTDAVPDSVTGGRSTVAVRYPKNPIAIGLIETCGFPLAAPSANSSGKPSPTRASHVLYDLGGKIDMIIDGGACDVGLESTIVDVTVEPPVVLRPGIITQEDVAKAILGDVPMDSGEDTEDSPKAPGMKYQHYSPKARITIVDGDEGVIPQKINSLLKEAESKGLKTAVLAVDEDRELFETENVFCIGSREKPKEIAKNLYKYLRKLDFYNIDEAFAESISGGEVYDAIMNRLIKAASHRIV